MSLNIEKGNRKRVVIAGGTLTLDTWNKKQNGGIAELDAQLLQLQTVIAHDILFRESKGNT